MKAKARDGHATIITCVKDATHVMIVACPSLAFDFMLLLISSLVLPAYTVSCTF